MAAAARPLPGTMQYLRCTRHWVLRGLARHRLDGGTTAKCCGHRAKWPAWPRRAGVANRGANAGSLNNS
eukprot:5078160-Lingulodinium_polyedra.AAC.1